MVHALLYNILVAWYFLSFSFSIFFYFFFYFLTHIFILIIIFIIIVILILILLIIIIIVILIVILLLIIVIFIIIVIIIYIIVIIFFYFLICYTYTHTLKSVLTHAHVRTPGRIPTSLATMQQIKYFLLAANKLTGVLPMELCSISQANIDVSGTYVHAQLIWFDDINNYEYFID